jgi:hypothetical protein
LPAHLFADRVRVWGRRRGGTSLRQALYGSTPRFPWGDEVGRFPTARRVHTCLGMSRALLLSLLSRQCLLLKPAAFRERYPHGWLVWESGVWNVPEVGEELGATRVPAREIADCLPESDVLCFELAPARKELTLGRSTENDIVINDATVSRTHLRASFEGERWWVEPLSDNAQANLNGAQLERDRKTPLANGEKLRIGDVTLTYHTVDSFVARVQTQAERLAALAESGDSDETSAIEVG